VAQVAGTEHVIRAWRNDVRAGWGQGPRDTTLDELHDTVAGLVSGDLDAETALSRIGAAAGRDGHPLDEVWAWLEALFAQLPRARRAELDRRTLAVAVAGAWAGGVLEWDGHIVPEQSLVVLELRLRQLYDQCAVLGADAADEYALALVEVGGAGAPPNWLPAVLHELFGAFGHEVVSVLRSDRVAMIVPRHASVASEVHDVQERLDALPALQGATIRAWVEPLAHDATHLAGHLAGLRL